MDNQNGIITHGDVLDVHTGSADDDFCTCKRYTNNVAFQAITGSPGCLELRAPRAKYEMHSGAARLRLWARTHYAAKQAEEFDSHQDLIVNNFLNKPNKFSDKASEACWQDTRFCKIDKHFKHVCKRSCLMSRRKGKAQYGIAVRTPRMYFGRPWKGLRR